MTAAGWLFMLGSLSFVWGLAGWCIYRLLRTASAAPEPENLAEVSAPPSERPFENR